MKNKGVKFLLVLLFAGLFAIESKAQEINLGGGIAIEAERPPFGLQFKGTYGMDFLLKNLSGSVEFSLFIPSSTALYKYSKWGIDVDGNWTFFNAGDFDFYAIGGLNITNKTNKSKDPLQNDEIGTKPGLNVGAGAKFGFSPNMSAYGEFKYILSNYDVAVINLGVLFTL